MRDILLVRPESKWRWVPFAIASFAFAAWMIESVHGSNSTWILVTSTLAALAVATAGWLGFYGAYARARASTLVLDKVRVTTHPRLALTLKVVGCVMLAAFAVSEVWPWHRWLLDFPTASRLAMILPVGAILAYCGWQRPWDLKVVERERVDALLDHTTT